MLEGLSLQELWEWGGRCITLIASQPLLLIELYKTGPSFEAIVMAPFLIGTLIAVPINLWNARHWFWSVLVSIGRLATDISFQLWYTLRCFCTGFLTVSRTLSLLFWNFPFVLCRQIWCILGWSWAVLVFFVCLPLEICRQVLSILRYSLWLWEQRALYWWPFKFIWIFAQEFQSNWQLIQRVDDDGDEMPTFNWLSYLDPRFLWRKLNPMRLFKKERRKKKMGIPAAAREKIIAANVVEDAKAVDGPESEVKIWRGNVIPKHDLIAELEDSNAKVHKRVDSGVEL